jgi:sec-independent protein translocase protein TatA
MPDAFSTLAFTTLIPGGWEWVIILALGLLIFGRRLPEVGRNIGKTVVEFRRGISDIERDVDDEAKRKSRDELPEGQRASSESADVQSDERAVPQQGAG